MKSVFSTTLLLILAFAVNAQTPPRAYDVSIQGNQHVNHVLSGAYSYADTNNRPEGNSIYRWYRADSVTQPDPVAIDSAFYIAYVVDSLDKGKYLAFEVTPVAAGTGDSTVGTPVRVWTSLITYVGINEKDMLYFAFYPNPATSSITFLSREKIVFAEVLSMEGKKIITSSMESSGLNISALEAGSYILHAVSAMGKEGAAILLKR
jgi:hypothetical protein